MLRQRSDLYSFIILWMIIFELIGSYIQPFEVGGNMLRRKSDLLAKRTKLQHFFTLCMLGYFILVAKALFDWVLALGMQ